MILKSLLTFFSALAFISNVNAATVTVDFSGHTVGDSIDATYSSLGLTFTDAQFLQCGGGCPDPDPSGAFAYSNSNDNSFTAYFTTAQTYISFQTVSSSSTLARAYDNTNTLIASVSENSTNVTNQLLELTGFGITKIVFSYNGGSNGPAITNLTFNSVAMVPEPESYAMMLVGLVGIAARRRATRN